MAGIRLEKFDDFFIFQKFREISYLFERNFHSPLKTVYFPCIKRNLNNNSRNLAFLA